MAQRFYKKHVPANAVILSNGIAVKFSTNDNLLGYFATDNEGVQAEFAAFQQQQRYGIIEITEEEYRAEYVEKKNLSTASAPVWREEWGRGASRSARQATSIPESDLDRAVAVRGLNDANINRGDRNNGGASGPTIPNARDTAAKQQKEEFKPATGRRRPRE